MRVLRSILLALALDAAAGFSPLPTPRAATTTSSSFSSTSLHAERRQGGTRRPLDAETEQRRQTILGRDGEHFVLDRRTGRVEFGSSAELVTALDGSDGRSICGWLSDERRVATSIWDENLMTDLGDGLYRLELMTLRFVTIQLAPRVDVRMWTEFETRTTPAGNPIDIPLFQVQSASFDPNIQILPGVGVTADSLKLEIEVVGELRPAPNGRGVTGRIGFVSSGDLTPPMRFLPEPALRAAIDAINRTIKDFAVKSFQAGAARQYREYRRDELEERSRVDSMAGAVVESG